MIWMMKIQTKTSTCKTVYFSGTVSVQTFALCSLLQYNFLDNTNILLVTTSDRHQKEMEAERQYVYVSEEREDEQMGSDSWVNR